MKNGVVHIAAFTILEGIARKHKVSAADWAKAAWGDPQYSSRISELRKLQIQLKSGVTVGKVGRVVSAEKVKSLLDGLKKIIGGENVKRELIEKLASVKTDQEKNLLLVLAAEDNDQKAIRLFIEALIGKNER